MRTERLYFFGDSICFGQYVSPHETWVTEISQILASKAESFGRGFCVQNPSINGNTTRMALERIGYDLVAHKPDYVWVQFGMNDCNYWASDCGLPRTTPESFEKNLIEIILRAKLSAKHVWLGTNHPSVGKDKIFDYAPMSYEDNNAAYAHIIRTIPDKLGMPAWLSLVDTRRMIERQLQDSSVSMRDLLLEDGIHLSLDGHRLYARMVMPYIADVIERA